MFAPFSGKPACQFISAKARKGVCAEAYVNRKAVLVPNVEEYPGHFACDGDTQSELIPPLLIRDCTTGEERALGVLDLDGLALNGFQDEDAKGLQDIVKLMVDACD